MSGFDNEVMYAVGERLEPSTAQAIQLMQQTVSDVSIVNYTANPEGFVAANPASLCHVPSTGDIYRKDSGTGNTGWVLIAGGGGDVSTLTPDSGGSVTAVAGTIDVFGEPSITAQVMSTVNVSNKLMVENRTWETAYVVDSNATVGERGTFTTIQDALDAIIADGVATSLQMGTIIVRPGTYAGFTHTGGALVQILGLNPQLNDQVGSPAAIIGSCTLASNSGDILFQDVFVSEILSGDSSSCHGYNVGFGTITGTGNLRVFVGSISTGTITGAGAGTTVALEGVEITDPLTFASVNIVKLNRCSRDSGTASVIFNGTTSAIITNCERFSITGNTTDIVSIQDTTITAAIDLPSATSIRISGVSEADTVFGGSLTQLVTQVPTILYPSTEGNIASRRIVTTTGNVTLNDQYVACRQSGAITLTLNGTFYKGQEITIADESGTASTNTITIAPSSGTINGAASIVLNSNYATCTVIFDGTNWFTSVFLNTAVKTTLYSVADSPGVWSKDSRTKYIKYYIWAGGAGSGSGRKGTSTGASGGGAGSCGGSAYFEGPATFFANTLNFVVGAGGTGGVAQTTDGTNGNPGNPGGNTTFGSITVLGGLGGAGGAVASGAGGLGTNRGVYFEGGSVQVNTSSGGNGSNVAAGGAVASGPGGTAVNKSTIVPSTAGGGGGADLVVQRAGGAGGAFLNTDASVILAAPAGGLESTGINGANGNSTAITGGLMIGGQGGAGGGGYSVGAGGATAGGTGGNGSIPGAAGGGGGGGISAVANSGAGGNGADGRILVIEYF